MNTHCQTLDSFQDDKNEIEQAVFVKTDRQCYKRNKCLKDTS